MTALVKSDKLKDMTEDLSEEDIDEDGWVLLILI